MEATAAAAKDCVCEAFWKGCAVGVAFLLEACAILQACHQVTLIGGIAIGCCSQSNHPTDSNRPSGSVARLSVPAQHAHRTAPVEVGGQPPQREKSWRLSPRHVATGVQTCQLVGCCTILTGNTCLGTLGTEKANQPYKDGANQLQI
eukprot:3687453-Amphidinium_carterae.1